MTDILFLVVMGCVFVMLATARGISQRRPWPTFFYQLAMLAALACVVGIVVGLLP